MPSLIVTFGVKSASAPLEKADRCRTQVVGFGGGNTNSDIAAEGPENVVTLLSDTDCWVAIATAPNPSDDADGSPRRALQADKEKQFEIRQGQKVGVTTR